MNARRKPEDEGRKSVHDEMVPPALRNRRRWIAVAYDITDDRRRTKVQRCLEGYGRRVQYSVFECEVRPDDLEKLTTRLKGLIRAEEDDVRIYELCETCRRKAAMLGKARRYRQPATLVV